MDQIEKSIVESLDGTDPEIFPYLPYILQDIWKIGADPDTMLDIVDKNISKRPLRILDLGCGKGIISIHLARNLDCTVLGIDALEQFISDASCYAEKYQVSHKCIFKTADIRSEINHLYDFDIAILGAIGPVLGNLNKTLTGVEKTLSQNGYVLLDDAYDESGCSYTKCLSKSDFYDQISNAGFHIEEERIFNREEITESDMIVFEKMRLRVEELTKKEPVKKDLFHGYLKSQEYEYYMLSHHLTTGTWLLKKH